MPIEKLHITEFLNRSRDHLILDVRSPGEYKHAHIPGAHSLPLFSDEERAVIGTLYKQKGRDMAVNEGLKYFSATMQIIHDKALKIFNTSGLTGDPVFFVHCWRGGMRSEAIAWLLNLYGYPIYLLQDGYKSYRRWALQQFEKSYRLKILGGFTGSGKTEVLEYLDSQGKPMINLEKLAHHKGSAFGSLGMKPQPSQEMFENDLAWQLWNRSNELAGPIWMEDESRHIGCIHIPYPLWNQMRVSDLYFLDIPMTERLKFISRHYGKFDAASLKCSILKIQKRLGGLETKNAIECLDNGDTMGCFEILLHYYDKLYRHSLERHEDIDRILHKISCESVDIKNGDLL